MKVWQQIRQVRIDLTDYVVHLTKNKLGEPYLVDSQVFQQILMAGRIRPTFAMMRSHGRSELRPTVKGPFPAVCFTEQPISALLATLPVIGSRYSGFGFAYHKEDLFGAGGRPVWYGSESELGRLITPGEPDWQEGREIYAEGLPPHLQFLWVRYEPRIPDYRAYPVDFTWEREWRIKAGPMGLPIVLDSDVSRPARGALIVPKDSHVHLTQKLLQQLSGSMEWAGRLTKIVSLETAKRYLDVGDIRFGRIETWPI